MDDLGVEAARRRHLTLETRGRWGDWQVEESPCCSEWKIHRIARGPGADRGACQHITDLGSVSLISKLYL